MPLSRQQIDQLLHRARIAHQAGRLTAAKKAYDTLLEQHPDNPTVCYLLGIIALQEGDYHHAIELIEKVIHATPNKAQCYVNLAIAYGNLDEKQKALTACHKAIQLAPELANAHYNLGLLYERFTNIDAACRAFQDTLNVKPQHIGALTKLISYAIQGKQLDTAELLINQLHHLQPDNEQTYFYQGILAENRGHTQQAQAAYQYLIEKDTSIAGVYNNLAALFYQQGYFAKAIYYLDKGLTKQPHHSELLFNKVTVLRNQGDYQLAFTLLRKMLSRQPEHALAHVYLSELYLLLGDFKRGWPEYAWHLQLINAPQFEELAVWQGEPLKGKQLLVMAEQGIGDCLQHVRFFTILAKQGADITFHCQTALLSLLNKARHYHCIDTLETISLTEFDYYISIASIPAVLQVDNANIPHETPYITVPRAAQTTWRKIIKKHGSKKQVGLVWHGSELHPNDKRRSVSLTLLQKVAADMPDISFYLLQTEPTQKERSVILPDNIHWPSAQTLSFSDAAAIIQQLDLVISVDTALAHLAGALACPVWLLLPFAPDWRWQLQREDTPWYPSMRLFRQSEPNGWNDVLHNISILLAHPKNWQI